MMYSFSTAEQMYKVAYGPRRELSIDYEYYFISRAHWIFRGRNNSDNYICSPLKTITHTHTHKDSHINITTKLGSL